MALSQAGNTDGNNGPEPPKKMLATDFPDAEKPIFVSNHQIPSAPPDQILHSDITARWHHPERKTTAFLEPQQKLHTWNV